VKDPVWEIIDQESGARFAKGNLVVKHFEWCMMSGRGHLDSSAGFMWNGSDIRLG
jgi:hypothetical protein